MLWQPENTINENLVRLIDPGQPLRRDDVFLPSIEFSVIELLWTSFWFGVFTVGSVIIGFTMIERIMLQTVGGERLPSLILIMLSILCCLGAFYLWKSLRSKLASRALLKAGRYRNGLFILDNAILIRFKSQIFYVERERIRDFQIIPRGRGESPDLNMVVEAQDHGVTSVNLRHLNLDCSAYTLKKSLINWFNTGEWRILTALSDAGMPKMQV